MITMTTTTKIKSGFYVSPFGYIVEVMIGNNLHIQWVTVDFDGSHFHCTGSHAEEQIAIMLSGWEVLID